MVSLNAMLPVSLNGMGVREGGTVLLLVPLGVSSSIALSTGLLVVYNFFGCQLNWYWLLPLRPFSPLRRCEPMMDLSVVIPIKDEQDNLKPLHERLLRSCHRATWDNV